MRMWTWMLLLSSPALAENHQRTPWNQMPPDGYFPQFLALCAVGSVICLAAVLYRGLREPRYYLGCAGVGAASFSWGIFLYVFTFLISVFDFLLIWLPDSPGPYVLLWHLGWGAMVGGYVAYVGRAKPEPTDP